MDKKTKKQIEVLRTRIQKLEHQLHGARQQFDDPNEVAQLEKELAEARKKFSELRA